MTHTLTITLDDTLYQELKDISIYEHTTVEQLASDLLKKQLKAQSSTSNIMKQLMKANLKAQEDLMKVKNMTNK